MATRSSTVLESETRITVHWSWTRKPVVRLTHRPTGTLIVMRGKTPDSEATCRLDGLAALQRSLEVRDQLLRRGLVDHYGLHPRETAGATTPAEPAEIPDDVALDELPPWEAASGAPRSCRPTSAAS